MPGGHASHKGTANKPNVNAPGFDDANDSTINPEELLAEGATTNTTRTQEFVNYPPALERPEQKPESEGEEE